MLPCCIAAVLLLVHVMALKRGFFRFWTGRTREEDGEDQYWRPPKRTLRERLRTMVENKSLFWTLGIAAAAACLLALSAMDMK